MTHRKKSSPRKPITRRPSARGRSGPAEEAKAKATGVIETVLITAALNAKLVGEHLRNLDEHLKAIDSSPEEKAAYMRLADQTLASLYLLLKEAHPSPTELQRLALRYALDARKPIDELGRYVWSREATGWRIVELRKATHRLLPMPARGGRLVKDAFAVKVLDCVLAQPPRVAELMAFIEKLLKKVPTKEDALPGKAHLFFQVERTAQGERMRLWIDDKEVPLKSGEDIPRFCRSCAGIQARAIEAASSNAT